MIPSDRCRDGMEVGEAVYKHHAGKCARICVCGRDVFPYTGGTYR